MDVRCSVVNMSKSCCFAVVLAVICILLSLEVHAQPTDETMSCSVSTLEKVVNMVEIVASNQQQNAQEVKKIKVEITSEVKDEIRDATNKIASSCEQTNQTRLDEVVKQIKDEIRLLATNPIKIEYDAWEPSKQALISALVCEYLACIHDTM